MADGGGRGRGGGGRHRKADQEEVQPLAITDRRMVAWFVKPGPHWPSLSR